ncbi:MAG: preprotein translocase subunit SecE [Thiomonas sp.]
MANPSVQTVSTGADKAKLGAAAVLLLAALGLFYGLGGQPLWLRVVALLVLLAAAVVVFFLSEPGKALIAYGQDAVRETKKVVWPSRKEAIQMTAIVFGFVILMAIFLWVTDKSLEYVLYDLILGWKR